jgi:YidC/Oxa1 family membrane protein insertase
MLKYKKTILLILSSIFLLAGCDGTSIVQSSHTGFWDQYLIYPLSLFIIYIGNTFFHQSIGFSIMVVTVGVRMLLAPLSIMQYRNQLNTKRIQPQVQKLKEKYAKSNKPENQQEYQREMMSLLQKNGANPIMGCLPLLIQFPVFSIIYYAIRQTDEISASSFLWMNLGHADPYFILPIMAALATYLQSKVMQSDMEGMNQSHSKIAKFISPLMVLTFGIFSPSGLVLYWITGSLFMIVQFFILKAIFKEKLMIEAS